MTAQGGAGDGGLSFTEAMEELEGVLRRIEGDEIDIDQLGRELGRAAELLEICRRKIRRAEVEVQQIVETIEEESADAGGADNDPDAASGVEPAGGQDDDEIPF